MRFNYSISNMLLLALKTPEPEKSENFPSWQIMCRKGQEKMEDGE
jgi:hypothetical protein